MKKKIYPRFHLMLLMLAVVTTFNITFYVASEYYNAPLGQLLRDGRRIPAAERRSPSW